MLSKLKKKIIESNFEIYQLINKSMK
jgi:hypothetical protein